MKIKKWLGICIVILYGIQAKAQIGYQVSLLNTATGEPQANKTVNVNITITNAENQVVHTEIQTATTNDFGMLSLSVGKEDTFKNADWNKLPFYISVSANGTLIGKSQILTVPVAEYAKTAGAILTKDMIVGKWSHHYVYNSSCESYRHVIFNKDGTGIKGEINKYNDSGDTYTNTTCFLWKIKGTYVFLYTTMEDSFSGYPGGLQSSTEPLALYRIYAFDPEENKLLDISFRDDGPHMYSKE